VGRLILIAVAVLLLVWLVRRALGEARRKGGQGAAQDTGQANSGELVSCAHCGVHLPRGEARSAGGRHYCSEEHWRLGPKKD
jgi:uncharacterized protein